MDILFSMDSFSPFISVIIPTYNRGEFLFNTLNDLLTQSYHNYEILVIEQSKIIDDNVKELCKKFNSKIKLFFLMSQIYQKQET